MIVDIPFLVSIGYVLRKHLQSDWFPNNPCCQITLGIKDITVFIGIFIDNRLVFIEELMDTKVDICRFWALKIPLCPIGDILFSQRILFGFKEFMFYDIWIS